MSASPSATAPSSPPLHPPSPKPLKSELSPSNPASTSNIPLDGIEAEKANPDYNPPVGFKCLWEGCPMNYDVQDDLVKHVHGGEWAFQMCPDFEGYLPSYNPYSGSERIYVE